MLLQSDCTSTLQYVSMISLPILLKLGCETNGSVFGAIFDTLLGVLKIEDLHVTGVKTNSPNHSK